MLRCTAYRFLEVAVKVIHRHKSPRLIVKERSTPDLRACDQLAANQANRLVVDYRLGRGCRLRRLLYQLSLLKLLLLKLFELLFKRRQRLKKKRLFRRRRHLISLSLNQ